MSELVTQRHISISSPSHGESPNQCLDAGPTSATYRIAHVDMGRDLRGGQYQLLLLANRLRLRGHEQLIVCPEASALEARARQDGFRVFALPAHDPGGAHGIVQLRQRLELDGFDLLHAHDGRGQTIAWLASLGMPVRRVASRRVIYLPQGLASRLALHRLKYDLTCDGVIAVSKFVRGLLIDSGVRPAKIEVIPDGIDVPSEAPDETQRARARQELGLSSQDFVVGQLGEFSSEKGQDVALESVLLLAQRLPDIKLLLAGDGPATAREALARAALRSAGRARLLGRLAELSNFFAALDLYIMPSRAEGLGSAALLAMAHGVAAVASRVGGLPEVVEEGVTGWLVPPAQAAALADAIAEAASDRQRLKRCGIEARRQASKFSADIMADRVEAFYARLISGERRHIDDG